jgi:hypothetical protein
MTKLNSEARRTLADAGITVRDRVACGGWLTEVTDGTGERQWVPGTEWRGDECEFADGEQVWRDHHGLRPHSRQAS